MGFLGIMPAYQEYSRFLETYFMKYIWIALGHCIIRLDTIYEILNITKKNQIDWNKMYNHFWNVFKLVTIQSIETVRKI